MARTKARISNGTILYYKRSGGAYIAVAEVINLPSPERTTTDIKASHLNSDNYHHEYLPGMIEPGQFECDFNYYSTYYTALEDIQYDREVLEWKLEVPDNIGSPGTASTLVLQGYINKLQAFDAQTDEKMTGKLGVKVTGPVTWTGAT